jgi:hypothetical protein
LRISRRTRRSLRRIRPLLGLVLVVSALLLVGAGVVGFQTWLAKGDLEKARSSVAAARAAVRDGNAEVAKRYLAQGRDEASRAHDRLWGWLWTAYGKTPAFGSAVRETRGVVEATNTVLSEVLPSLVSSAPSSSGWTGTADVAQLRRIATPLRVADTRLGQVRADLRELPVSRVRALDDARQELTKLVDSLAIDVREAAVMARVLPALLGDTRPTRLLLVTQNLAEERATGGLIGAFALVRADRGKLTLERSGTDEQLVDASSPVVDLGPDFAARYGVAQAAATWRSANLTPDVPSVGKILAGLSERQLDRPVDGVILVDPVALAYVLRATGPIQVPGLGSLAGDNATALLLKDVYARYPSLDDQRARKAALRRALESVVRRLEQPASGGLLRELARAAATGHAQLFASDEELENELRRSRIGGALPNTGPYLSVVTQDVGGSKLDYYLQRRVTYEAAPSPVAVSLGGDPETVEEGTVTVRLRNTAPFSGLPPYVTYRADNPKARPLGQLTSWVSVYLGPRSTYESATLNGRKVSLASQVEQGLCVFSTYVSINPGQSATLVIRFQQPAAPGSSMVWRQQPRLEPDELTVRRRGARSPYVAVYDAG